MTGFLESLIVELLLQYIIVVPAEAWSSFSNIFLNHTAWQAQEAAVMNSASVVESVTTGCFFKDQDTAPELSTNKKPDVLFLSSKSPA